MNKPKKEIVIKFSSKHKPKTYTPKSAGNDGLRKHNNRLAYELGKDKKKT